MSVRGPVEKFGDAVQAAIDAARCVPGDERVTTREMIAVLQGHAQAVYSDAVARALDQIVPAEAKVAFLPTPRGDDNGDPLAGGSTGIDGE